MKTKLVNYDFDSDFKNLDEGVKKFIALGQWSLYKLDSGEYLIATDGGCKCCHGGRQRSFFTIDSEGNSLDTKDKSFYDKVMKEDLVSELIRMTIPDRISRHFLKIRL